MKTVYDIDWEFANIPTIPMINDVCSYFEQSFLLLVSAVLNETCCSSWHCNTHTISGCHW